MHVVDIRVLSCANHFTMSASIPRHTLSVLVENKFGVLTRIAGMLSGRGFNIDSLNVGPTLDPSTSRMTIVVRGDDRVMDQVCKLLAKLIDVKRGQCATRVCGYQMHRPLRDAA